MQRLYRWVGVWDAAGIAAREKDGETHTGMVPLGNVEWLKPPKRRVIAATNTERTSTAGDADVEKMKMHPSAFVRPAWLASSPLVFSMSETAWVTIADSQSWLESDEGKTWLLGAASYTLLALDS